MKKTLITLLSLAGVAMAETCDLTIESRAITLSDEMLELTLDSISGASSGTYSPTDVTGATGFSPKIQFVQGAATETGQAEANAACYWLLTFTIENKSSSAITIDGLTLGMSTTTATGGTHSGIKQVTNTLTFANDEEFSADWDLAPSDTQTIQSSYVLAANSEESFTLKVQRTEANRNLALTGYATITSGSLSYSVIPEPTTATLSLLALAGLAARRRRR